MKRAVKIILTVVLVLVLIVGAYVAYVFIDYYRLDDNIALTVTQNSENTAETDTEYRIITYNIGFGAYSADYSFFMDGGEYSRAYSKDAVLANTAGVIANIQKQEPDFVFVQEVDTNSTRSYGVDQSAKIASAFGDYSNVFAQNYDSPYLFYPFLSPHGKSVSGIMTLADFSIDSSLRRSLPIETSVMKLVDLDRCYSVTRIPLNNGAELCLYNVHLSAYTSDGTIAVEQIKMLLEDMENEYAAGNYIVCGGDFNKDMLGNSASVFGVPGEYTWAQPFPTELLSNNFYLVSTYNGNESVPSCRNTDAPYIKGETFVITVDGFIVSENVEVISAEVLDAGFLYSDHNPVMMDFILR